MKKLNQLEADSIELDMDLEKHFNLFMLEEPYVLLWKYYDIQHTQWKLTYTKSHIWKRRKKYLKTLFYNDILSIILQYNNLWPSADRQWHDNLESFY